MKKLNKKGFMLVETLIVSTFIMTILIFLYVQFRTVTDSYNTSFKYNNVNNVYIANNIRKFLNGENFSKIKSDLASSSYIDVTNCPSTYITETSYCRKLFTDLNVSTVIVVKDDLTNVKGHMNTQWSEGLKDFIRSLKTDSETNSIRLIVEFTDNTYASLKFVEGE